MTFMTSCERLMINLKASPSILSIKSKNASLLERRSSLLVDCYDFYDFYSFFIMYWLCGTLRLLDEECLTNGIHYYYYYMWFD